MYPKSSHREDELQWYNSSPKNSCNRYVRIIVTSQNDAMILIVFTNPVYPEYQISNKTNEDLEIGQM